MEKYYFTFGSWEKYPFQNTYLVVVAANYEDALATFRENHPDVHEGVLNCADFHTEEGWKKHIARHYEGKKPAEIIWSKDCFGKKPEGFVDVFFFVPEYKQIVRIEKGWTDNLPAQIVEHILFEVHSLEEGMPIVLKGKIMTEQLMREKYECLADSIPEVLDMVYGDQLTKCMILNERK